MLKRNYLAAILFGSLLSAALVLPAAAGEYGALAAGFWKDDSGVLHVASGVAKNYSTPERAADAANEACFEQGKNCHVVREFAHGGCGFIAVGSNAQATRYGVAATSGKAYDNCKADGFDCKPAKGGCTETYED
ncbi:MAG TPA: DUF4189 domain-containing protein [Bradyrhizobium sp.]|jgi:hypothetical protein